MVLIATGSLRGANIDADYWLGTADSLATSAYYAYFGMVNIHTSNDRIRYYGFTGRRPRAKMMTLAMRPRMLRARLILVRARSSAYQAVDSPTR